MSISYLLVFLLCLSLHACNARPLGDALEKKFHTSNKVGLSLHVINLPLLLFFTACNIIARPLHYCCNLSGFVAEWWEEGSRHCTSCTEGKFIVVRWACDNESWVQRHKRCQDEDIKLWNGKNNRCCSNWWVSKFSFLACASRSTSRKKPWF